MNNLGSVVEQDEFIPFMEFEEELFVSGKTVWHLYAVGKGKESDPLVYATEEAARRAAISSLQSNLRELSRWVPSVSRPGGYDLTLRVYAGKDEYKRMCTIVSARVEG